MANPQHPIAPEPLHEIVLRTAFLANTDRPELLSTEDVFWKLEDPNLMMSSLKEVLEWLVRQGDMERDLGKYILSRSRFFELKEANRHLVEPRWRFFIAPIAPLKIPEIEQAPEPGQSVQTDLNATPNSEPDGKQVEAMKTALRFELGKDLQSSLKGEIIPELKESLKITLAAELKKSLPAQPEPQPDQEEDTERWNELKAELKDYLKAEVGEKIQPELDQRFAAFKSLRDQSESVPDQLEKLKTDWSTDLKSELTTEFQNTLASKVNLQPAPDFALTPEMKAEIKAEMQADFEEFLHRYMAELAPPVPNVENQVPEETSALDLPVSDFPRSLRLALPVLLVLQMFLLGGAIFQLTRPSVPAETYSGFGEGNGWLILGMLATTTVTIALLIYLQFLSVRPKTKESQS